LQWSNVEQTNKTAIQERKIKVLFLPADDAVTTTPQTNGVRHQDRSSMLSSPSPEAVTPQRGTSDTPVGSVSRPESRPADSKNLGQARESAFNPASSTTSDAMATVTAAASAVTKAVPTSAEELQAQLAEAKATISRLTQQAENGLRQRKTEVTSASKDQGRTSLGTQQPPSGGVSVQITALLCLLSFLLAYLLF
jgi:hypothetical protein